MHQLDKSGELKSPGNADEQKGAVHDQLTGGHESLPIDAACDDPKLCRFSSCRFSALFVNIVHTGV